MQRLTEPEVATPDDLASDLLATNEELLLVGDGALRYREVLDVVTRIELADPGHGLPAGRRRSCSSPTPAPCGRSSSARRSSTPLYLRRPDAEINWQTRDTVA